MGLSSQTSCAACATKHQRTFVNVTAHIFVKRCLDIMYLSSEIDPCCDECKA